jgi:hypothetical protein
MHKYSETGMVQNVKRGDIQYKIIPNYVTLNSKDRDVKKWRNPFCFEVDFDPQCRSTEKIPIKKNGKIVRYETREYGGTTNAFIKRRFQNIAYVSIERVVIPSKYACNLPYVVIKIKGIEDFHDTYYTTSHRNDDATSNVYFDRVFNLSFTQFNSVGFEKKFYYDAGKIDKLRISFHKPCGDLLVLDTIGLTKGIVCLGEEAPVQEIFCDLGYYNDYNSDNNPNASTEPPSCSDADIVDAGDKDKCAECESGCDSKITLNGECIRTNDYCKYKNEKLNSHIVLKIGVMEEKLK